MVKKVTQWKLGFRRAGGRPKRKWGEHVLEGIKRLRIHNRRGKIRDRKSRKRNHKGSKDERGIGIGTKEDVK